MRRFDTPRQITEFKCKVTTYLNAGWKVDEIADHLGVSKNLLRSYYKMVPLVVAPSLGHKNETYMTEEEMIQGYQAPTFEELSNDEKIIYMAL